MQIEKGFYYHYKHDPQKGIFDAAYEILGSAFNTESGGAVHSDDATPFLADEMIVYRPLFESSLVRTSGRDFWIRPIAMFTSDRFIKITDAAVIVELAKAKDAMYN